MTSSSYSADEYNALFPQPELDSPLTKGRFTGKVAIVTGGNSGIGRAVVDRFSNDGAAVFIFARDQERGNGMSRELQDQGRHVKFYQVDVTDRERCFEAAKQVADENGGSIHYLVNNAAINKAEGCVNMTELSVELLQETLSVNVMGLVNMVQACFPYMKTVDLDSCAIVNVGSATEKIAFPNLAGYSSSKGAARMLTKCMALDLSISGIRVNSVSPGTVWTPLMKGFCETKDKAAKWPEKLHMTGQLIEAAGVASVIAFLCSKDAMYIDGADIPVDCGMASLGPEGRGQ